ncbi:MAG TPA: hypothetical protein V6D09_12520 [Leptolyngbyaceae cyanobacterium]
MVGQYSSKLGFDGAAVSNFTSQPTTRESSWFTSAASLITSVSSGSVILTAGSALS